jgi:hypothetical protein|tara:strand:- start:729 stop:1172 length:444 start_codon:yes stop_codon:yes gene_type:complete
MTEQKEVKKVQPVSLKSLLTPSKTVSIDYPGYDGFSIDLTYLSREELVKLRNKCLKQKFNKKTRAFEDTLDEELFLIEYVSSIIKGWTGLKYKYLEEFLLVDVSGQDLESELGYTAENAELLMKNSGDFDQWVTDTVGDLENFTQSK